MKRHLALMIPALILISVFLPFASAAGKELSGKISAWTIMYGGMKRSFLLYLPSEELKSPALIIALHGSVSTGKTMREISSFQFDRLADREKCIIVYPDGYKKYWNDCRTKPNDDAHVKNIDDVGFISRLIDTCCSQWHADPKRVYVVGFSNGGHLGFRLAREIPDKIAGIAAIGAGMPAQGWSKCPQPENTLPVMIVNGSDDPINPFSGGMVKLFRVISKGIVISSIDSAKVWLPPEDKDKQPKSEMLEDRDPADKTHVERLSWQGSRVLLYIVHGGGHTIPGGKQYLPEFLVGRTCRDMDTAEEAWKFFNRN